MSADLQIYELADGCGLDAQDVIVEDECYDVWWGTSEDGRHDFLEAFRAVEWEKVNGSVR